MELSNLRGRRETWWGRHWWILLIWLVAGWMGWVAMDLFQKEDAAAQQRWRERTAASYSAWVKLTGRTDITLEEWKALKNAGALNNK